MSNQRPDYRAVEVSLTELSPLMLECLAQGQEVLLTVTGNSMSPFLRHLCWSSRLLKKSLSRRLLL